MSSDSPRSPAVAEQGWTPAGHARALREARRAGLHGIEVAQGAGRPAIVRFARRCAGAVLRGVERVTAFTEEDLYRLVAKIPFRD